MSRDMAMTTIAARCACGNYIAIVSSTAGQREIDTVIDLAALGGCEVIVVTDEMVAEHGGPGVCGKQKVGVQLSLFEAER